MTAMMETTAAAWELVNLMHAATAWFRAARRDMERKYREHS